MRTPTARAAAYDDFYLASGLFADRDRPGWHEDRDALVAALAELVVVDSAAAEDRAEWQKRTPSDDPARRPLIRRRR